MTLESLGVFLGVLAAFITGVGGLIISLRTSLNSVSQKELRAVHDENERLRKQIKELDEKIARRDATIEQMRMELDERIAKRDATIEQMRVDFSAQLEEREARIQTLENEVEALQFKMREIQQENELLRGEVERYRRKNEAQE